MLEVSPELLKTLLGSGGALGLLALAARWYRSKAKLRGRFVREKYDINNSQAALASVTIELENIGREATSVKREVKLRYFTARTDWSDVILKIEEQDRTLYPVTPREFVLSGAISADYLFSHFREFTIEVTRGNSVRLRVLNASGRSANWFRFLYLKLFFVLAGKLPHIEA